MRSPLARSLFGSRLTARTLRWPIAFRPEESDAEAFHQVIVREEYAGVGAIDPHGIILDCGANVGYTTAWLLSRFPRARVIAIEPHPENVKQLKANLAPYGQSVEIVEAAVWPTDSPLVFAADSFRDGLGWSTTVREARPGEAPQVRGVSIPSLISQLAGQRIALLKMDIEGAEHAVFCNGAEWLEHCDNIAIELHDERCERAFLSALPPGVFQLKQDGELTFCSRAGLINQPRPAD